LSVDNTRRQHQCNDRLSVSSSAGPLASADTYIVFSSWTHVHTSSVWFMRMKVRSWQTDRQTDGWTDDMW